jgi:hypothetical protein
MFLGSRARPVRKDDNLTVVCEPTVYTMSDPQHLTNLLASTAYYGDSFTFYCMGYREHQLSVQASVNLTQLFE